MAQIKGIGDDAPEGWILEEFEMPMPKGLSSIVETLKDILKQGKVHSIHLKLGQPIIYTRFIRESEAEEKRTVERLGDANLADVARNVSMTEYASAGASCGDFFSMLLALSARRLHLTHIGIGTESRFFEWLLIDPIAYAGLTHLAGAELIQEEDLPNESVVFFAGPQRSGRIDQITYALKCYMPTLEELQQGEANDGQESSKQGTGGGNRPQKCGRTDGAMADLAGGISGEDREDQPGEG